MSEEQASNKRVAPLRRHGARYRARQRATEVLYEAELRDLDPVAIADDRTTLAQAHVEGIAPVAPYGREIVTGVAEELDRLDELIAAHLHEDWELERISAVDRAVLRVAVWELVFNAEVPVKTVIADAVELSSQLSQSDSPKYINGLLDTLAKRIVDIREQAHRQPEDAEAASTEAHATEATEADDWAVLETVEDSPVETSESPTLDVDKPEA